VEQYSRLHFLHVADAGSKGWLSQDAIVYRIGI
jgi:hypothetical protein